MLCPNCQSENRPDRRFCARCGAPLAIACPACGAANEPGDRFCGQCGTALVVEGEPTAATPGLAAPAAVTLPSEPVAERKMVSVLFTDLVGFTSLAEERDSEEMRELLTAYFDSARRIIDRYGGTVEKFIGDAVMAVWGVPTARENDAELAVRAALDLVMSVSDLRTDWKLTELRLRAGVVTGEAAVTLGATSQGMVTGDVVNTASRVQAVAPADTVLCDDATRRATETAIAYEPAGTHELKGKARPVALWHATRVIAGTQGSVRAVGLEAPFVGRERELRLVKELFHAAVEERRARMVTITGMAGIGKSRLSWEFEKYIDGLVETVFWHRGRCIAYGEGVTYWALAEMVRSRALITEDEGPGAAIDKLRAALNRYVADPQERAWLEPRLASLLGLEERASSSREDLFAAWRLFFERLAEQAPPVLVFEDLQWADAGLLDFVEYLLDWSRQYPLFIVALARPELTERRPSWGAAHRSVTPVYLEPLGPDAMDEMLGGLVPGLPDDLRQRVAERAEGIPLYGVETVRMLLDQGTLRREDNRYTLTGDVIRLDVPETLHALIAARLDGLSSDERRLLQDASVMGQTFTKASLTALTGLPDEALDKLLSSLVHKDLIAIQADPMSPERGQYGFLQTLVRTVAYETLSKRDRKLRHLQAAANLETRADADEIPEVLASHYLEAYRAAPDADDAEQTRTAAQRALVRAGERAASLGSPEDAERYFLSAAELVHAPLERAELLERAGVMAMHRGVDPAAHLENAIALFEAEGATHAAARVLGRLGEALLQLGKFEEAIERMEGAFAVLAQEEHDQDLAALASELARFEAFTGRTDSAAERIELVLDIAERREIPEMLVHALNTKHVVLTSRGRNEEAFALVKHALDVALRQDLTSATLRSYNNVAYCEVIRDRHDEALAHMRDGLALARRLGDRPWEWILLGGMLYPLIFLGRWDEALAAAAEIPEDEHLATRQGLADMSLMTIIHANRGELETAERVLARCSVFEETPDIQERTGYQLAKAVIARMRGDLAGALRICDRARDTLRHAFAGSYVMRELSVQSVECAIGLGELARAAEIVASLEDMGAGMSSPYVEAQLPRFRALVAAASGDPDLVEPGFRLAQERLRSLDARPALAMTLLEHGEWLRSERTTAEAEPLLAEAAEIFEELHAVPWLERIARARPEVSAAQTG